MKKIIALALCAAICLLCCSCTRSTEGTNETKSPSTTLASEAQQQSGTVSIVTTEPPSTSPALPTETRPNVSGATSVTAAETTAARPTGSTTVPATTVSEYERRYFDAADPTVLSCLKIMGRTVSDENGSSIDWTGSSIEFSADCSGDVSVALLAKSYYAQTPGIYFTVYIDGERAGDRFGIGSSQTEKLFTMTIATGLTPGMHSFRIVRQTEAYFAACTFSGITLCGALETRPRDNNLLIEFIGDSITVGMGNLGASSSSDASNPVMQDGTQAFAFMAAENLGVDYRIVARTGIAAYYGYSGTTEQDASWYNMYGYENYYRYGTEAYSSDRMADVVCIALGTNDYWSGIQFTETELAEKLAELAQIVLSYNTDAKIVFISGGINDNSAGAAELAVKLLDGNYEITAYHAKLSSGLTGGGQGHPNTFQHNIMANQLMAFLLEHKLV